MGEEKQATASAATESIDGIPCFTVTAFASATDRTPHSVYQMISGKSAGLRPLKVIKKGTQYFIPVEEMRNYPFIRSGRYGADHPYRYSAPGVKEPYPLDELQKDLRQSGKTGENN